MQANNTSASKLSKKTISVSSRLLSYLKKQWLLFLIAVGATLLAAGVDSAATYALKPLIDKGFISRESHFIYLAPLLIFSLFGLRTAGNFIANLCLAKVTRTVVMVLRRQMFLKLLSLPASYFNVHSSGEIVSKLLYDVEQVSNTSSDAVLTFVQSAGFVLGLLVVMFSVSWQLSGLFLLLAPFMVLIVRLTSNRVRRVSRKTQQAMAGVTAITEEAIQAYREVKIYGGQNYELGKFQEATLQNYRFDLKVVVASGLSVAGVQWVAASAVSLIVYLAINPHFFTVLSPGSFASLAAAMLAILKPLKDLTKINADMQRGLMGAKSVFEFLDEHNELDTGTYTMERAKGGVRFKAVGLLYPGMVKPALENISLTFAPGQVIALVGRSGSGKTSLVNLLSRFYEPTSGKIYLDNIDIHSLTLGNLRSQIALVNQQVVLFNGSIKENITYGISAKLLPGELEAAIEAAQLSELLAHLPQGLETPVGENGVLLSGGQRQRIAIARALLKNAPVLILDEATSALDIQSERAIQIALEKLMKQRTTFVIAHRLSTIEKADCIVVLQDGHLVEMGRHRELRERNGYYAELYRMQFHTESELGKRALSTELLA